MTYFQIFEKDTDSTVKPVFEERRIGSPHSFYESWNFDYYTPGDNRVNDFQGSNLRCINKPERLSYFRFSDNCDLRGIVETLKSKLIEICYIKNVSKAVFILSGYDDAPEDLKKYFEVIGNRVSTREYLIKFKSELEKVVKELIL
jgi:hypothetical protein